MLLRRCFTFLFDESLILKNCHHEHQLPATSVWSSIPSSESSASVLAMDVCLGQSHQLKAGTAGALKWANDANISHQTGSSENHRLKSAPKKTGYEMGYVSQFPEKPRQQNSSLTCSFPAERRRESFVSPRGFLLFRHRCWMLSTLARTASSFFLETKKPPLHWSLGSAMLLVAWHERKYAKKAKPKARNYSKPS